MATFECKIHFELDANGGSLEWDLGDGDEFETVH